MHSNESSRPKQNTFNIDKVVSISFNRNKKVKSRVKIRGADYAAWVTVASRRLKNVFKTFTLVRFSFDRSGRDLPALGSIEQNIRGRSPKELGEERKDSKFVALGIHLLWFNDRENQTENRITYLRC